MKNCTCTCTTLILLVTLLFLISVVPCPSSASRILFILPIATKSHKNVFEPLARALANRGHEITFVSPSPTPGLPSNVREINPLTMQDFASGFDIHPMKMRSDGKISQLLFLYHNLEGNCDKVYRDPEFKRNVLSHGPGYFDLIFFNGLFNQCFFGLHVFLEAPFAVVTTMGVPMLVARMTGNYYPTSFVPFPFFGFTDRMTFVERVTNFLGSYFVNLIIDLQNSRYESVYRKHLGADLPGLDQVSRNVSLIFGNEHHVLTFSKPHLPDTIPIGGIICRPAKPLPKELEDFVSDAKHGVIYFSMGTVLSFKDVSKEFQQMILNVFSRLEQKVIWKWDNPNMTNVPNNVLSSEWLPQQDILGHSKIKLFVTHGGLLSTQEAVYHGVPLLGIPVFVDQDLNMANAEAQGFALKLEILEITEEAFESKIRRLLDDPMFTAKAKHLSTLFRDSKETPLERAIFWTEYVIRHKGATHLRSAARDLNVFQLHSLDVILFLVGCLVAILYLLKVLIINLLVSLVKTTLAFGSKQKRKVQ